MIRFVNASQLEASILMAKVYARALEQALKGGRPTFAGTATGKTFEQTYPELVNFLGEMSDLRPFYQNLTIGQMDTYWCPEGHMWSQYSKEIFEALVIHVPGSSFAIPYGKAKNPQEEAAIFADYLQKMHARPNEFYIQFVGTGENGHIAFNEPGTSWSAKTSFVSLTEDTIRVNAKLFNDGDTSGIPKYAITTGMLELQKADLLILGAFGSRKAEALYKGFYESPNEAVPISILQRMPCVLVCADNEASSKLPREWFITPDQLDIDELVKSALALRGS